MFLLKILQQEQFKIFAPYYDGLVVTQENDSSEIREKTYNLNIKSINECNLVLAVIDDFDPGTIFEMGYASSDPSIDIISYSDVSGRGLNLMLQQASWGFANGEMQLREQLRRYKMGESPAEFLKWEKGDVI